MRRFLTVIAAAAALGGVMTGGASAAPAAGGGAGLGSQLNENPLLQDVRVYCYNRYTGRFLHWGYCGSRRPVYYRRPGRTYCYNRYSGRFLHWGSCRRW